MSVSKQRARDLVPAYGHSLEQQIVGRGSNLACRDEELWTRVEGLLKDGDAPETHCLGLDPLRVMEESLAAAAASTAAAGAGRVRTRGGLQGLAKAFEVLEQAALNLYLGPWRDEYKVVKMYSGMFTHFIKPVLSMPQIEKLFGLLGYRPSSSRHEQLRLQSPRVGPASLDDLLCLSCAFFLARCECFLLRTALGKHAGEAQWELSVVRERQRGNCLQVALENTKKTLGANQPQMELYDGDAEVDLYTDEHVNGGQREAVLHDDESPHSLTWVTQSTASPPAAGAHSNRVTSLSSPTTREHVCVSKLDCQLREFGALSLQGGRLSDTSVSPTLSSGSAAMSSLALCDDPKLMMLPLHPIAYHDCCDLTQLDPQALCISCGVFHTASCREIDFCQRHHDIKLLGVCSCGRECSRKPLVLCRYCGNEYCRDCWYRNPVACSCGQTFDQSSPV